ncbi:MAG: cardiolipin synthase [Verrucomicrobia bacterium]|nr:cardiolipin synthase [Verrucomicrobiota bacterium]
MIATLHQSLGVFAFTTLLEIAVIVRILLRRHRDPAARIAWIVVVIALPLLGLFGYLLLGEVNIGRARARRLQAVLEGMPKITWQTGRDEAASAGTIPDRYRHLFELGHSISGFPPVSGNVGSVLPDSNAAINAMIADIESATKHVHVLFYIWLPDHNGIKMAEALKRASARGVICRVIADDLGSRRIIRSKQWREMHMAGVRLVAGLPIGNLLLGQLQGRIDLRNHRKIVIVDDRVTYCGSQNCADPEFRVKAKYAPWIDLMIRFEGPIVRQNQFLFASDWMTHADEDLGELLSKPLPSTISHGFPAQAIGTGPTVRYSAMPETFESLMFAARSEIIATTPYYVPDESLHNALCTTAYRGVNATIIFPARNDSWFVGSASRSYYADLLDAGVKVYEYKGGLLHTKSMTVDGEVTLIGSANMDRRSFDLNYENNILFYDCALTWAVRECQQNYVSKSSLITKETVASWPIQLRLWNNLIATLGPVL